MTITGILWADMALIAAAAMMALMALVWLIHIPLKNAGIVDIAWAFGLAMMAWLYAMMGDGHGPRRIMLAVIAGLWGLRLAAYLFIRVIGKPEDSRYRTLRDKWKENILFKFFLFFEFQAVLNIVLSVPFLMISLNPSPSIHHLEWIGAGLWLIGLAGESLADYQLKRFKSDPANKGKVCQSGLWNYSRHPNYFFEWLIWIAYAVIALPAPYGWIAWIAPALMLHFLIHVTGIAASEEQAVQSKGEAFRAYQQSTSAFVPWFKKK